MSKTVKRQICKCQNCGNEAEMIVTCSLPDFNDMQKQTSAPKPLPNAVSEKRVQGHAVCTHCGNEADMWIDL
jgi:hypothetical protein